MRCLALLYCSIHAARGDEIVSIVTTAEGFERGATARQLPAYDLYNRAVHAATGQTQFPISLSLAREPEKEIEQWMQMVRGARERAEASAE